MSGVARLGHRAARIAQSVVPDPFVIAILLAVLAFGIALLSAETADEVLSSFVSGALSQGLIAFAFQMALILVTGHALAETRPVQACLGWLANQPKSEGAAAVMVAAASVVLGLFNWGLGLVAGAFLAREVGRAFAAREQPLNYPLIGAAGYLGLLVWHGGLSGSAPLKVAEASAFGPAISVDNTLFSSLNITAALAMLVVLPALFWLLSGEGAAAASAPPLAAEEPPESPPVGLAAKLERSRLVSSALAALITLGLIMWILDDQPVITLNGIILIFLALGLWLHDGPRSFARAFGEGTRGAAGILLQFPIYFGILQLLKDAGTLPLVAGWMTDIALNLEGLVPGDIMAAWLTFGSAALLNLLVPSGGGQWALQAPIIKETAEVMAMSPARLVMAFAYGDQLTNMLQPFWALPLLSITGLKARDLLGYSMIAMMVAAPIFLLLLAVLG